MIMPYSTLDSPTTFSESVATVECRKQVRSSWQLLHFVLDLLIRGFSCLLVEENDHFNKHKKGTCYNYGCYRQPGFFSNATVTGTIFGFRRGKVSFCIQTNPKSTTPELLLELAVPTTTLAREMKGGFLRIALKCNTTTCGDIGSSSGSCSLLSMPAWTMFCNGRKVGFAVKRSPSNVDMEILQQMKSVVAGADKLSGEELKSEDDVMYLRGKFQRVHKSPDSESFSLIDPDCNIGQELSFFFLRS